MGPGSGRHGEHPTPARVRPRTRMAQGSWPLVPARRITSWIRGTKSIAAKKSVANQITRRTRRMGGLYGSHAAADRQGISRLRMAASPTTLSACRTASRNSRQRLSFAAAASRRRPCASGSCCVPTATSTTTHAACAGQRSGARRIATRRTSHATRPPRRRPTDRLADVTTSTAAARAFPRRSDPMSARAKTPGLPTTVTRRTVTR